MQNGDINKLPNGTWLYLKGLPINTTSEELSAWFHNNGLRITPDAISIKGFNRVACAIVSITPTVTLDMFRWTLQGAPPFDGKFHFSMDVVERHKWEKRTAA